MRFGVQDRFGFLTNRDTLDCNVGIWVRRWVKGGGGGGGGVESVSSINAKHYG